MHDSTDYPAREFSALDTFHHSFATRCAELLTGILNRSVRPIILPPAQLPYHDVLLTCADPTFLLVCGTPLFAGHFTLELHPHLAYLILEQLLGAPPADAEAFVPPRKFTDLELQLLSPIFNELLNALTSAWPVESERPAFHLVRTHATPHATHIVPDQEQVTILPTEFSYAGQRTQESSVKLTLCLPSPALAALQAKAPVEMASPLFFRAFLNETTISDEDLASLQPGDILTTTHSVDDAMELVSAEGPAPLHGRLVQFRGQKALLLTGVSRVV